MKLMPDSLLLLLQVLLGFSVLVGTSAWVDLLVCYFALHKDCIRGSCNSGPVLRFWPVWTLGNSSEESGMSWYLGALTEILFLISCMKL